MRAGPRTPFESVALELVPAARPVAESAGPAAHGLHVCPACDSKLVYPIAREERGSERWSVTLRCPECELRSSGEFAQDAVDALELELDRGEAELAANLSLFLQANMTDVVNRFVRALDADPIQPMDF